MIQTILLIINATIIVTYWYSKIQDKKSRYRSIEIDIKYQRCLRNILDYQNQMYDSLMEKDYDVFTLCAQQVQDELAKCEKLIEEKSK